MAKPRSYRDRMRARVVRTPLGVGVFAALIVGVGAAHAQPTLALPPPPPRAWAPPPQPERAPPPRLVTAPKSPSLLGHFGLEVARSLLTSEDPDERMRGIERLGSIGDAPAIEALLDALDSGAMATRDPMARLHAVRLLAPHAARANVRTYLVRELLGSGAVRASMIKSSSALALAELGDEKALEALAQAIDQRGASGEAALAALRARPPSSLDAFLFEARDTSELDEKHPDEPGATAKQKARGAAEPSATATRPRTGESDDDDALDDADRPEPKPGDRSKRPRTLTPAMIDFFADLGDLRALPALRLAAARKQIAVKSRAGVALARLGDPTGVADARTWAKGDDPKLLDAAAETLILLRDPGAASALTKLLANAATRQRGLELSVASSSPELLRSLVKPLEAAVKEERGEARARAVMALARASVDRTGKLLDDSELRDTAAYALAGLSTPDGWALLESRFAKAGPSEQRLLARMGIVRAITLGQAPDGLEARLEKLVDSRDEADREAGTFGLVAVGRDARNVLERVRASTHRAPDASVVSAAARASLLVRSPDLDVFASLLVEESQRKPGKGGGRSEPSLLAIASGVALTAEKARNEVPLTMLVEWAEGGGPLAPLAAEALGARDDEPVRQRIVDLLHGTDPVVRAHTALGLAADPEPSSVSLLVDAYLGEEDAVVRRACVRALAARKEVQRERVLRWANDLDPDDEVRALARLALRGHSLPGKQPALGSVVGMVRIARADGAAGPVAARFVMADGASLPVVAAADGVLLTPSAAFGSSSLTVTAPPPTPPPTVEPAAKQP